MVGKSIYKMNSIKTLFNSTKKKICQYDLTLKVAIKIVSLAFENF